MIKVNLRTYQPSDKINIIIFFCKVFKENNRILKLNSKDIDISDIEQSYCKDGNFWCLIYNNKIIGTIGLRKLDNCYEIRRFFVLKKYQGKGYGKDMLSYVMRYAFLNEIEVLKLATMNDGNAILHLLKEFGFEQTTRYNNSTADLFWRFNLTPLNIFSSFYNKALKTIKSTLILNPTENFPYYVPFETKYFEGVYVSERYKQKDDIVIFGGRNSLIDTYDLIKDIWKSKIHAEAVDLKTLSGLNAHLILFLCIANRGQTVLLLSERAGGHFSTEEMLKKIGMNVYHFPLDLNNYCVNRKESEILIEKINPDFIFIDRSEGLIFEDFSWLGKYKKCIKIFDASQYLTQIVTEYYPNPLLNGFDYFISSLHKNFPGPQKSIIATNTINSIWDEFLINSKTFISNTHPENIFKSVIPLLDNNKLNEYSSQCIQCNKKLEQELLKRNIPIIKRSQNELPTLHIWLLPPTKEKTYEFFLKLEALGILVNYRKLPYDLGYGLRLGVNAAVQQGLRLQHIIPLADIIKEAYISQEISPQLLSIANKLIKEITAK